MADNILDGNSPLIDPEKDYYPELVGDGKKYKDNKDLAYSKMHADVTIQMRERELDQLRKDYQEAMSELQTRAKFEELLDRANNRPDTNTRTETQPKPEINMTEIETLVAKKIQQTELERKQKENLDMVKAELSKRFGDNLENRLKEVGLDGESAAQLAKANPQLVLKALGVDKTPDAGFTTPPRNTSAMPVSKSTPQRTWSYYQNLFNDPKNAHLKYDPRTNTQMQKDYIALGQAFEDGDFKRFGETSFQ